LNHSPALCIHRHPNTMPIPDLPRQPADFSPGRRVDRRLPPSDPASGYRTQSLRICRGNDGTAYRQSSHIRSYLLKGAEVGLSERFLLVVSTGCIKTLKNDKILHGACQLPTSRQAPAGPVRTGTGENPSCNVRREDGQPDQLTRRHSIGRL